MTLLTLDAGMFSDFRRAFGALKVEQTPHEISIEGIPADVMQRDIFRIWHTSKINAWMFTKLGRSELRLPLFFAPDFVYALQTIADHRYGYTTNRVINQILTELHEHTWLKDTVNPHPAILNWDRLKDINLPLIDYQREFLENYDRLVPAYGLRGFLLAAAPGSGKTLTGLALASCLEADATFVICPKNAVNRVWEKTIVENLTHKPKYWLASNGQPYKGQPYIVCHYETLDQAIDIAQHLKGAGKAIKPVVLLDECHNFNDPDSLRTQLLQKLCQVLDCQHVLFGSGTPMKALGTEAIPLMRVIDPLFTSDVEMRFKQIFGRSATRALDILQHRLGLVSFKVAKSTIQKTVPIEIAHQVKLPNAQDYTLDKIRQEMLDFVNERREYYAKHMKKYEQAYFDGLRYHERTLITNEQRSAYSVYTQYFKTIRYNYTPELHKEEVKYCNNYEQRVIIPGLPKEMREPFKNARSVVKYVELKIMGEALGGVLGRKRAKCHVEMVPHMELDAVVASSIKKSVIFTSYVDVVKTCDLYFRNKGYHPMLVYQDTNKNLPQILKAFEENPQVNPLITTYPSLATAVPLVMANTALFINQPFRDYEKNQAQSRLDRLGQDTQVYFHNYYLDTGDTPNISTRAAEILTWSRNQVEAIMGKDEATKIDIGIEGFVVSCEGYVEQDVAEFERFFRERFRI